MINHSLTMREAGQRVHPHLSRFTVASIIRTFRLENRYVFNSPLQTVSTVFTVVYRITLLYCKLASAPFVKKIFCFVEHTEQYSTIEMLQYCVQHTVL